MQLKQRLRNINNDPYHHGFASSNRSHAFGSAGENDIPRLKGEDAANVLQALQ
jgi:hypothetical protein